MKKNKKKVALITGITGQDGALLAKYLLEKDYIVHGVKRRSSSIYTPRYDSIYVDPHIKKSNFVLHYGDLTDYSSLYSIISKYKPNEIYNLGAQSHVQVSFEIPIYTNDVNATSTVALLEIIKNIDRKIKFYQASTSEMFGDNDSFLNENSDFKPQSPYAASKLYSYWLTRIYRQAYGLFASNGILFNHESPLRGENFVTQKVVSSAVKIKQGKLKFMTLGNLYAKRDWGDAEEFVDGMWKILNYKKADDFILATGKTYTIKYFVEQTFKLLGIKIKWTGKGIKEKAINVNNNQIIVKISKDYFRPLEVPHLKGDFSKAKKLIKWKPKTNLKQLIQKMISNELKK